MEITNEKLFFEYIGRSIDRLSNAYSFIAKEIEKEEKKEKVYAAVEYDFLLKRLNLAIDRFKIEMKECLKDYVYMKKTNMLREENAERYIKNQLKNLHNERRELIAIIPKEVIEEKLGHNFYFHNNLENITSKILMLYFEVNYTMLLEKDL